MQKMTQSEVIQYWTRISDDLSVDVMNQSFLSAAVRTPFGRFGDPKLLNANGGAIAVGHPLGASGGRILGTLAKRLTESGERWGVAAICIGVGQGLAVVLETVASKNTASKDAGS
jgi:acetyl-CoA acyltransferase